MNQWINTKDRLPEKRQPVLFTNGATIQKGVFLPVLINKHSDFENVFMGDDEGFYQMSASIISHWMPLPDLPEKK